MSRVVLPNLFSLSWAPSTQKKEGPGIQLRWSLRPDVGLPRNHFIVWVRTSSKFEPVSLALPEKPPIPLAAGPRTIGWGNDPMAIVSVSVTCEPGQTVLLRAYDGPGATGKLIDENTISTTGAVIVYGSVIRSVLVSGTGSITGASAISTSSLVNDPGWVPIERVGMPIDEGWGATGYPLDKQGRIGEETSPIQAALQRLVFGGPEAGWSATNDRSQAMPPWEAPIADAYVEELRKTILPGVQEMLEREPEPHRQARYRRKEKLPPPRSIHGDEAKGEARAIVAPLGSLIASGCSDPFAALGLGFGTYVSMERLGKFVPLIGQQKQVAMIAQPQPLSLTALLMVTVDHELVAEVNVLGKIHTFRQKVTLADVNFHPTVAGPPVPSQFRTDRQALDRPEKLDFPFLESVRLRWRRPVQQLAEDPQARSFALTRAPGGDPHQLLLEKRLAGGHRAFVAARPIAEAPDPDIQFVDRGVPEPRPNPPEPEGVVYSVTAQDWFGRWSSWISTDHVRTITQPQVPVIMRVDLVCLGGTAAVQPGAVDVEFAWNWADRSPESLVFEIKLHDEASPAPAGSGSILSVGGALVSNPTKVFGGSATPPAGVEILIDDPPIPNLVRYKARITGITLDFTSRSKIAASVRMLAFEHLRPSLASGFSRTLRGIADSPVPPPRPPAPPGMIWTSLPDPRGFARAKLTWTPTPSSRQVVYVAEESAMRRELNLPAADMQTPAHQRLLELRGRTALDIRKAFRRIAEDVTSPFEVELAKGSRAIHFYTIVSVSPSGIESPFPGNTNAYFAVATPRPAVPEVPQISTRSTAGGVEVELILPPGRDPAVRVDLHRTGVAGNAVDLDRMGPPIAQTNVPAATLPWDVTTRPDGSLRLRFLDASAPANWAPQWYRAVAWSANDDAIGTRAARSPASAPSKSARPSTTPPLLTGVSTQRFGAHVLIRWTSNLPRQQSPLGAAGFVVVGRSNGSAITRRSASDRAPLIAGPLPDPEAAPEMFVHDDPVTPEPATYCAWFELPSPIDFVIQASDPAGRTTTLTARHEAP
jgi:hypothetical protein